MQTISLKFKEIDEINPNAAYSDGCSGSRSDCCTRVCTRNKINTSDESLQAWDEYLDVNAGVLQY